jgi:hypothetical protein
MRFYDIISVIVVIAIFIGIYLLNILAIGKKNIEKNWPKYRCNPMIMPFAGFFGHDPMENFVFCIQNMQTSFMGNLLKPINYSMNLNHTIGGSLGKSVQNIRKVFNQIRTFATSIFKKIFGVFLNILVQVQFVTIKMKDIFAKIIGVSATFLFLIDGTVKSGNSIWRGPVGGILRTLCFHPNTHIHLQNGSIKEMRKIKLNDVLENGSRVTGILSLQNVTNEPFYEIYSQQYKENIYVTGSHLIYDENSQKFIFVKNSKLAKITNLKNDMFSCLITSDSLIKIGEHTFWDYEDDNMVRNMEK